MTHIHSRRWLLASLLLLLLGVTACGASTAPTSAASTSAASSVSTASTLASPTTAASEPTELPSAAASVAPAASTTAPTSAAAATAPAASAPASSPAASSAQASDAAEPSAAAATPKLDLNSVTEDELLSTIPDFGNRMVREFFEYRPYVSITQFRQEIGKYVDDAQVALYEQYVYVPIDINNADAATLQQLPGVDATLAEQLIAARPYDSTATFLATLAETVSPADAAVAEAYLVAP